MNAFRIYSLMNYTFLEITVISTTNGIIIVIIQYNVASMTCYIITSSYVTLNILRETVLKNKWFLFLYESFKNPNIFYANY